MYLKSTLIILFCSNISIMKLKFRRYCNIYANDCDFYKSNFSHFDFIKKVFTLKRHKAIL